MSLYLNRVKEFLANLLVVAMIGFFIYCVYLGAQGYKVVEVLHSKVVH